jgi:mannose-6-phosphate isomerase
MPPAQTQEIAMTVEHAFVRAVDKPWGSTDLQPWSKLSHDGAAVGELWFQRADERASSPTLLVKLLFTTEPLSIQVHPDDAFARSVGLDHGKTEAWYILSASSGAHVATGLKTQITIPKLRASIEDGSIADLVQWRGVEKDDTIFVPAGTIHSIGPGIILAEIQQRSDVTYRLFDYDRHRGLQVDDAVAVADAGPADSQPAPKRLADGRTLLVANSHFVLERVEFLPHSIWELTTLGETWFLILDGNARIGSSLDVSIGDALFVENDHAGIKTGAEGLKGLLAYVGPHINPDLLHNRDGGIDAFQSYGLTHSSPHPQKPANQTEVQ